MSEPVAPPIEPFRYASMYRERGWQGVLPLPPGAKSSPPDGFTGHTGRYPTDAEVAAWVTERPSHNIAIRVPDDVLGIDVDAYEGKRGRETLEEWDEQLETPLPPTWVSSSRNDGISGIRWFRVPAGLTWKSDLGRTSGIEIIRHAHRYAVVPPSVRSDLGGAVYTWISPAGEFSTQPPSPSDLTELPEAWIEALRRGAVSRPRERVSAGSTATTSPSTTAPAKLGDRPSNMYWVKRYVSEIENGAARNNTGFSLACQLRDNGTTLEDALLIWAPVFFQMLGSSANVGGSDGEPYSPEEFSNSLRSAYSTEARDPVGGTSSYVVSGSDIQADLPSFSNELTETGNGDIYVELFAGKALFTPRYGWRLWDGTRWVDDKLNETFEMVKAVLILLQEKTKKAAEEVAKDPEDKTKKAILGALSSHYKSSASARGGDAMLKKAGVHPRMRMDIEGFDSDPYLFVVKNGTLDLRTQQIRESLPSDFNTRVSGVEYSSGALCPEWRKHVTTVACHADGTPDSDLEAYLQRWAGYTLTGLVNEQKFIFAYGDGNNGKSVFIEVLLSIMGEYGMRGSAKMLTSGSRDHETVIADLAGRRMVFIDEVTPGRLDEERLKELTGAKKIRARKIAKDSFEFDARFKLWLSGNNKPLIVDVSDGFWRRLDLAPFEAQISSDRRIKDYQEVLFSAESSGILNWCLEGFRSYQELGGLAAPKRVIDASAEYREGENTFAQMVRDCFVDGPATVWYPNGVLHWIYKAWCEDNGFKREQVLSMQRLANNWKRSGFVRDETTRRVHQGVFGKTKTTRGHYGPPTLVEIPADLEWRNQVT